MKNRLAAIARRVIPYNPEFRKLPLVKSVNAALLLQQLDYWFDRHTDFYKFLEPAPNHHSYLEGDSWTEELGFSAEEFTTAFRQIGLQYKSCKAYGEATNKFVSADGTEYYYASYIDRRRGITKYVRNHKLLDAELLKLVEGKEIVRKQKPEYHEEVRERIERLKEEARIAEEQPPVVVAPPKPKPTPEEIAAEKARKEEEKRLRKEAKAKADQERKEKIDADNKWRYDLFGSKERYMSFNGWFWGTYIKQQTLEKPDMFYTIMLKSLNMGAEKFRHIVRMFEIAEQKQAQEAQIQAVAASAPAADTNDYFAQQLTSEELAALNAANLDEDLYNFCLRVMEHQTHSMRMKTIRNQSEEQEVRNYRKTLVADES